MDWKNITLIALFAALIAVGILFIFGWTMDAISNWKYRRRKAAEEKAERDDLQDRRLRNLESR